MVYKLLKFIENQPVLNEDKNLKVYKMDDYEWWVSDKSKEETIESYVKEYGEDSRCFANIDNIEECNLKNDRMFWDFENTYIDELIENLLNGKYLREIKLVI